ncbi:MAG TPA: acyltransferase family protein, partial [Nitrospira sp.]|nr:acyltransferase family protein [Nitrospira sp.]
MSTLMLTIQTPLKPEFPTPVENLVGSVHVERSSRFDVLRVVACLAVILLHLAATIVRDHEFVHTIHWQFSNAINAATSWCVPLFVMLSGALLLDPKKHVRFRDFWAKRMSRLLPALVAWSAIYFAWRALYWHEPVSLSI